MKAKLTHIEIELSKQEYLTLKAQARHVSLLQTDIGNFFDADTLLTYFSRIHEKHYFTLSVEQFLRLKKKLKARLAEQDYQKQMLSAAWREFFECINQLKF